MWFARLSNLFGWLLIILAAAHLPALMVAVANLEAPVTRAFLSSTAAAGFAGISLLLAFRGVAGEHDRRLAFLVPILIWVLLPAFAALPFYLSGGYPTFGASYFEAASALTTTGLTISAAPSELAKGILFWRAFLQWIGGFATIIVAIAIYARLNLGAMQLFASGLPGGEGELIQSQMRGSANTLLPVYVFLTAACCLGLWASGEGFFRALLLSMATLSTGGFTDNAGGLAVGGSGLGELILILFMLAGATNLTFHWRLLRGRRSQYWGDTEFRRFCQLLAGGFLLLAVYLLFTLNDAGVAPGLEALRRALFTAASAISTTGFLPQNDAPMSLFASVTVMGLVLVGGTVASTAGGLKVLRVVLLFRHAGREVKRLAHPHSAAALHYHGRAVADSDISGVSLIFASSLLVVALSSVAFAMIDVPFPEALPLALAALTNAGPAVYMMAPDFTGVAALPAPGPLLVTALMVFGRLEGALLLAVLSGAFWRR